MDFGIVPFLLFLGFIVFRIAREAAKVDRERPGADGPLLDPQRSVEGSRNISDFLEELKRMQSPAPPPAPPEVVYDETRELRRRVREAACRNREMKTRLIEDPPPVVQAFTPFPSEPVTKAEDFFSASAESAYSKKVVTRVPGGLAHPVFSGEARDQIALAQRAIVLREVLGPPLGLR